MKRSTLILTGGVFIFIFLIVTLPGFKRIGKRTRQDEKEIKVQLDIIPDPNQVDYSPADGSTVKVNPPPFTWLPVRKKINYPPDYVRYSGSEFQGKIWVPLTDGYTYTLQISMDKNFNSGVITRKGIDISTYSLDKSLERGEWFWRYSVENGETIYSKVRRFIVPSDLKKRPFPDIKQVINSISKSHPRLFMLKDEVESYRNRALYGDLKETISEIKNDIEKYIGEELPEEPDVIDFWPIYNLVIPFCDMTETFGLVYLMSGDAKYGEEAKRRVLHFSRWNPEGTTSDRGVNESNYRIVDQGLRAFDWTYELFTPEEREIVEKSMIRRAEQLYHRLKYRENSEYHVYNRGSHEERITGFLGQAAIFFIDSWDEAEDWLKYVLTIHWNLYPAWAKEDGGWHQGLAYWTFYQFRALHFVTALKRATGVDLMQKDFFQNTPYYILYSNPPYSRLSPFGDGAHNPPSKMRAENMYIYSSLLNDPYLRWYADYMNIGHPKNILGILLKNDAIDSKSPSDLPQTRYFPGIGLVSLHTDFGNADEDIHFLFHSDPYGGVSHGHPDQNAFTIEAFGEALAIASGYYPSYGSDHHRFWTRQTKSTNNITINGGKGQEGVAEAKGEIVSFENRNIYDYVLGDATQAYMGLLDKFHRTVIHIRPGVFVIYDDLEAPEPVTFEWWLHALSEMNVDESDKSILISEADARLKVNFIQSGKLNFKQFTGFKHPPEVINYTDVTMPQFCRHYKDHWHLKASTVSKSTTAKFISVLVPYKKDKYPDISVDNLLEKIDEVSMRLSINGKKYLINLVPEISVKEIAL